MSMERAAFLEKVIAKHRTRSLERVSDALPKARTRILEDYPRPASQTLLRLVRALAGREPGFTESDVDALDGEALAIASALAQSWLEGNYTHKELEDVAVYAEHVLKE